MHVHKRSKFAKQSGRIQGWTSDEQTDVIHLDPPQIQSGESQTPLHSQPIKPEGTSTDPKILKRLDRIENQQNEQTQIANQNREQIDKMFKIVERTPIFMVIMQSLIGWMFMNFVSEVQKDLQVEQIKTVSLFIKTHGFNIYFTICNMIGERVPSWDSLHTFVRLIWRKLSRLLHIN